MARDTQIADALAPLKSRLARLAPEREILRVVGHIPANEDQDHFANAREEVLKWASKRAGGTVPDGAWRGEPFESLSAGRTTMCVTVETGGGNIWSIRGDDPDKGVAGRVWSTEITLGQKLDGETLVSVRLLMHSVEPSPSFIPATPGVVQQIAEACGLDDAGVWVRATPFLIENGDDASRLVEWLSSAQRKLPAILISGDERSSAPGAPLLDADTLAKALCGLAHVVVVPAQQTYVLSDAFGKSLSVFHGAVRICNPGFDELSDPFDHRLYLSDVLRSEPDRIASEIRASLARDSLTRSRLGRDVVPFATTRSIALRVEQEKKIQQGADETEQLTLARNRIDALENENQTLADQTDQSMALAEGESDRADLAEKQLHAAWARVEQLEAAIRGRGDDVDAGITLPDTWDDFAPWCEGSFSGRLSLSPSARKGVKKPAFQDIGKAAECIQWLANDARNRFLEGGGTLANISLGDGIINAPCGSDEYAFDFQGRRLLAAWHIKSGGNTRQPERCLRIYYAFDDQTRQIIVSDMPAHLKTSAS